MYQPFAVQIVPEGAQAPEFMIVAAETVEAAIEAASEKLVEEGKGKTHMIGVFDEAGLTALLDVLKQAKATL